ncbi:hypothetical protein B5M09_001086 [Aphanomyces astaci]|uniref:EGF-like domain-containing protein n=1 Tax=Aphanomyces astaci TaxID=112090 RepID=A0A425DKN9_APHAT|nr:hypothetical protein B5M09_001086 [Aphanomyces astaci]
MCRWWKYVAAAATTLIVSRAAAGHECIHNALSHGVPLASSQSYDAHPHEGRSSRYLSAQMDAASASVSVGPPSQYKPIRITPIFDTASMNALGATNLNFVKNKLVADALAFWGQTLQVTLTPCCFSNSLQVIPINGTWFAQRNCIQAWQTSPPVCAAVESQQKCMEVPIPDSHFAPLRVCSTCPLQGCAGGSCASPSAGTGVPNTDYVLYVRAVQTASCGTSVLAYATSCQPPIQEDYKCPNGVTASVIQMPSDATVQFFTERGHSVAKLVTPNVLSFVRNYFNCATLNGAEIEDSDGGCLGSHWEERIFEPELMSPLQSYRNPVSGLTLSYFQDTGWYQVNFTSAQPMYWGANRGCPFASDKCIQGTAPVPTDHFCVDASVDSCSVDLTSRAVCTVRTTTDVIPAYDQYFSNDPSLGGSSFADYCPIYTGYKGGDCYLPSNLQAPTGTSLNLLGETYSPTSFCLKSTLLTTKNAGWSIPGRSTGCYATTCSSGVVSISVVGASGTSLVSCSQKGQTFTVTGFTGSLVCPDPAIVCNTGQCVPACGANAICTSGKCNCVDGFTSAEDGNKCAPICPNACSGNGVCDNKAATCTCNPGFGAADCSATTTTTKKSHAAVVPPCRLVVSAVLWVVASTMFVL